MLIANRWGACSVYTKDINGFDCLHYAANFGSVPIFESLKKFPFFNDWTKYLHIAVQKYHRKLAKYLLAEREGDIVNEKVSSGVNSTFIAVRHGLIEMLKLLILNGAVMNLVYEIKGIKLTLLHLACQSGNENMVKFLLDRKLSVQ